MGTRVAFIWALQDAPWFAHTAGPFIRDHQIGRSAITAAFVLMAVTIYGFRFAVIAVRARQLPTPALRTGLAPPAHRLRSGNLNPGRWKTAHVNEPCGRPRPAR